MGPSPSALLFFSESASQSVAPTLSIPLSLALVALLLFINGYFVALEFALVALRKTKVDEMARQGLRGSASVKRGKDHIDDFVAAAQLGITIASLALGAVAEKTVVAIINSTFHLHLDTHGGLGLILSLSVVTVFHVVIGEQVPKMVAIDRPERVALVTAPLAEIFLVICKPAIRLLSWLTSVLLKPLGVASNSGGHHTVEIYSEEEIQALLLSRQHAGEAEPQETQMITQVFHLFEMVATEIMIPRTEMVCLPSTATVREVMELASTEGYDRYPVYGQNIDEIVGILLMKDIVSYLGSNSDGIDNGIASLLREPLFVPGSLPCAQLLTQMREKRTRLVIVIDEYGGTAGMLTLGDVLTRIVGDLDEEAEEEEPENIVTLGENLYSISGLVLARDVEKFFHITIDDELNDTIGGVIFSRLGRAPEVGDDVSIEGLTFRVDALDGMRIDRLLVKNRAAVAAAQA